MNSSVKAFLDYLVSVNPEKYYEMTRGSKDPEVAVNALAMNAIEDMARQSKSIPEFLERFVPHLKATLHEAEQR